MHALDYPADGPLTGPGREAWLLRRMDLGLFDHLLDGLLLREQINPTGLMSLWKVSRRPRLEHFLRSLRVIPERMIYPISGSRMIVLTEIKNVSYLSGLRLFAHRSGQLYIKFEFNYSSIHLYGSRPYPITRDELVARDLLNRAIDAIADPTTASSKMHLPII